MRFREKHQNFWKTQLFLSFAIEERRINKGVGVRGRQGGPGLQGYGGYLI